MTHICVSRLTITGSDNGLLPGRRQAIIWTNAGILLIVPLGTNFSENLIEILTFSFTQTLLWSHQSVAWICNSKSHNIVGSNYLSMPWIFWVQDSPEIDKITSFKHSHIALRRKKHIYMTGMYGYLFHYEINFCIPSVLMWRVSTFHETVHDANMCFCYRASATTMLINNLLTHWG